MTVTATHKGVEALTLTFVAEFTAGVDRVWQVWEDPRQLERWWGPPSWPASFTRHEFRVGGQSRYHMTGPEGEKAPGWWTITAIDAPHRLEFDDGFAGDDGEPAFEIAPMHMVVRVEEVVAGSRMTVVATAQSAEHLERLVGMGMEEGTSLAMGQIDAILAG